MTIDFSQDGRDVLLEAEQIIAAPREHVFAFFSDAANLERITPGSLRFEILTPRPIEMRPGAIIDYRLRVRGLPMKWKTEITVWDPPHRFIDIQRRGPYAKWEHEHIFEEIERDATRLIDRIRYRLPGGPVSRIIDRAFVRRDAAAIFRHRQRVIDGLF